MILLAIDPSLRQTGYSILDLNEETRKIDLIHKGTINTDSDTSLGSCLWYAKEKLQDLIDEFQPNIIVQEAIHVGFANAVPSQWGLNGIIHLVAFSNVIPLYGIRASTISKLITGDGKPPKGQRKKLLRENLYKWVGAHHYNTWDESDSVSVGIAHCIQEGMVD